MTKEDADVEAREEPVQSMPTRDERSEEPPARQRGRGMGMRKAALIQLGSRYASIAAQLVISMVLARLVSPEEFGILAIVTVFTSFFSMFSDMGISTAIVQFRDLGREDFQRLFGFSVVLATGIALLFCLLSFPISWAYGEPALVPLCMVGSLSLLFATLNMVPNGIMLRERRFAQIGLRLIVATLMSGALGIALAMRGWGSYALVFQTVVSSVVVFVWNYANCALGAPRFRFATVLRKVFSYSAYQFAFSLVNYFNRNLDNLLIGKVTGPGALGYYDKAYRLTTYPMSSFSSVIASVIQPFMAEHQDDRKVIFDCWLRVVKLCSLVGVPIAVAMFCCSEEIIMIAYGDNWMPAVPLLHALSVSVYAQMVANPTGAFFQSLGHTDLMFRCGLCNTLIMVVGIVCGLATGQIAWVARLVSGGFFAQLAVIAYFLVHRGFHEKASALRTFLPEAVAGVVAATAGMAVGWALPRDLLVQMVGKLAVSMGVLAAAYGATHQLAFLKAQLGRS